MDGRWTVCMPCPPLLLSSIRAELLCRVIPNKLLDGYGYVVVALYHHCCQMSRAIRNDLTTELGLMEFSEQEIKEIQSILRSKLGDYYPVIKKAMDIEDYLYREALYKNGQERNGNVWESAESINSYVDSLQSFKVLMKAKQGDWNKLYQISDVRQFCMQITSNRAPAKKKVCTDIVV